MPTILEVHDAFVEVGVEVRGVDIEGTTLTHQQTQCCLDAVQALCLSQLLWRLEEKE